MSAESTSQLETTYRRALRWYPRRWRELNADAALGTLMEQADEEKRVTPGAGEIADLRTNAMRTRFAFVERLFSAGMRNRASAIALGLGTAVSIAAIVQTFAIQWAFIQFGSADSHWASGPLAAATGLIYLVWIVMFVCALVGLRRTARGLAIALVPISIVIRIVEDQVYQVAWASTLMVSVLIMCALIVALGTPSAIKRGRTTALIALSGSVLATAAVDLWQYGNPFAQSPIIAAEYLLGGGPGFFIFGVRHEVIPFRDVLLQPFVSWFAIAVPLVLVAAGILNRLRYRSFAGALIVVLVPMVVTLVFAGPGAPDIRTAAFFVIAAVAVVLAAYWLLRAFGIRVRVTRA